MQNSGFWYFQKIHALEEGTNAKPSAQFDPLPPSG
jgi:hypothetical protein